MTTPPDRFREWAAEQGLDPARERVRRMFHTRDVEELPSNLQNVAVMQDHRLVSFHLTDDPQVTREALASGKRAMDVPEDDWRWGRELGPGFYVSNVPSFWVARSRRKWEFLDRLDAGQLERLTGWLLARLDQQRQDRYISVHEHEYATRQVGHVRNGALTPDSLVVFAGQPYNIRFWRPDVLGELGIEPGGTPSVMRVEAVGWFVVLDGLPQANVLYALVQAGFDGALVVAGLASNPEGVIWNPQAVVDLRLDERETQQIAVAGPRPRKTQAERYEAVRQMLVPREQTLYPGAPRRHTPEHHPAEWEQDAAKLARQLALATIRKGRVSFGREIYWAYPYLSQEFERRVVNWALRHDLSEDSLLRAGLAALNATWLGMMDAPLPARLKEVWGELPLQILLAGMPASVDQAREDHGNFPLRFAAWRLRLHQALLAVYRHSPAGADPTAPEEPDFTLHIGSWLVEMSNLLPALAAPVEQWGQLMFRWFYQVGSVLGSRRRTKRTQARGEPHFKVGGYGLQAVMLMDRGQDGVVGDGRDEEALIHRFMLRFVRDLYRGLPLAGLSSLRLDLPGDRPLPF